MKRLKIEATGKWKESRSKTLFAAFFAKIFCAIKN